MKKKKRERPEWDDGRTIANMNVDGMPWYSPENAGGPQRPRRREAEGTQPEAPPERMSREESRYYTWGALKAALAVIGVMCAGLVLFILFCQFVWFR